MKIHSLGFFCSLAICGACFQALAQGTAFTYQGHLTSSNAPANGFYDFSFALYNAGSGGAQVGSTVTSLDVGVTNGLFTVVIDFGNQFNGSAYWLQIGVRTNGGGTFATLSPLQPLTPTPYAITAENALSASTLSEPLPPSQLPAAVVTNDQGNVTFNNLTINGSLDLATNALYGSEGPFLLSEANDNFFAGQYAGNLSLTGVENTGVGATAMPNVSAASYNSAFGFGAMYYTTTGSNNTATGLYALSTEGPGYLTGSYNTADGAYALDYDNSGFYNTGVGYLALYNNQSGSDNIAIGVSAGYNITGSSNIDIGHPGVTGENLTIRIGSDQTATYIAGEIFGNGGGLTNLNLSGSLVSIPGNDNFFAGQSAGNASVSGSDNVGVGGSSLNNITSGQYNTATGVGSLGQNTNGSYNSAFGVDALSFNGEGVYNTAIGADTLALSGYGSYNTAVGASAMAINSGSNNTALGYHTLYSDDLADNNTAIGYYSMGSGSATSGGGNSGLGGYSLYSISSGYNNTAAGYSALEDNQSGVDNVAVGTASLQAITANSLNTSLGTYSLQYMTNGQENIALGYAAGYNLKNGSDNIYLGNEGAADDNNIIRIGSGQTETYTSGILCIDGGDAENGLQYLSDGNFELSTGEGPFLFGYDGGALGAVGPTTYCLTWDFSGNVWVSNNFSTATLTIRGGSDLAEPFKITPTREQDAEGSVMVIDEEHPGQLKVSTLPYDSHVAGVLSGANGVHPGIQMQQQGLLDGGKNVALTGRVYVQADTSNGVIKPGDLLTTSTKPGRAMKVTDHVRAQGAILGKAMTGLVDDKGMVLVLVTLQ